jgi:hypothetical protein
MLARAVAVVVPVVAVPMVVPVMAVPMVVPVVAVPMVVPVMAVPMVVPVMAVPTVVPVVAVPMVVLVVAVPMVVPAAQPLDTFRELLQGDEHHQTARKHLQHPKHLVRSHGALDDERKRSQDERRRGVGNGDRQAQDQRVADA